MIYLCKKLKIKMKGDLFMKATGIVRPIDELGRVVIPKELRKVFQIKNKDAMEIFVDQDMIILKKYEPACIFCDHTEDVVLFNGKQICKKCIANLSEALKQL